MAGVFIALVGFGARPGPCYPQGANAAGAAVIVQVTTNLCISARLFLRDLTVPRFTKRQR